MTLEDFVVALPAELDAREWALSVSSDRGLEFPCEVCGDREHSRWVDPEDLEPGVICDGCGWVLWDRLLLNSEAFIQSCLPKTWMILSVFTNKPLDE